MAKLWNILGRLKGAALGDDGLSSWSDSTAQPFEFEGLTVRCQVDWATAQLREAWEQLAERIPDATPFQRYDWQLAANSCAGAMPNQRLITAWKEGQMRAVLPLAVNGAGGLGSPIAGVSDYLDPLVDPAEAERCWRGIMAFLISHWDHHLAEIAFHNVRETASTRIVLPEIARNAGLSYEERIVEHAPAINLPGTWEAYLDSLDARDRKELRRKLKKAETQGAARLEGCDTENTQASLNSALDLMEAIGGEKADAIRRFVRPILTNIGSRLIRTNALDVLTLHIQGKAACRLLQFSHASGPMLYNMGWEPSMKEWSPGIVAVAMSIRRAIEARFKTYDLLRGRESYKYELGAIDRPLVKITLKRS